MAIQPVEIKDTILKDFTNTLDFAVQEHLGGVQSSGRTTGQKIIDGVGAQNLSNLGDFYVSRNNLTISLASLINTVYCSPYGDNVSGNGSILSPLKSVRQQIITAKINGLSSGKQIVGQILGGEINDSDGQIKIPPFFSLAGITNMTGIANSQDIVIDVSDWMANSGGQSYFEGFYTTGNVVFDFSSMPANPFPGFISIKNVSIGGTLTVKGNSSFIQNLYLYNSFIFDINLDYIQLNSDSASWGYSPSRTITNCPPVRWLDNAPTIFASGTRANFTPTESTVEGNLTGIDTALGLKANISSLASVAFSGAYSDLTGTPTIPSSLNGDVTGLFASNSIAGHAVTNAKLAQMAANTVKANITGSLADASDTSLSSFKTWLGIGTLGNNQMVFTNGGAVLNSNSSYVADGAGNLTISGRITNIAATFNLGAAGSSNFVITGTNAAINIGNTLLGLSSTAGAYFTSAIIGDINIRQGGTSNSVNIGVGTNTAQLSVQNAKILANVGIQFPTSGGTASLLSYNEESQTFNTTVSAPDNANHTLTFTFSRTGKFVTITWPTLSVTSSISTKFLAAAASIPSRLRPIANMEFPVNVVDNLLATSGTFKINSDGSFEVGTGAASNNFSMLGTAAFNRSSITYATS